MQTIIDTLSPVILHLIGAVLTLAVAFVARKIHQWTGIEIEARHREALHSALMTGARAAIHRGLTGTHAVLLATGYAESSVPDAIARLRPSESVLTNLARAKLAEVTAR